MRKCRLKSCRAELPSVKESDFYQKQNFCNVDHMAAHGLAKARQQQERARLAKARQERAKHREAKQRIKPRSKWLKEAQSAVNAFVRERDRDLPCVSCGRFHDGQYHAGHYRSVGSAPELRFSTEQIWKQCAPCNNHLSGNLINYRIELIRRIGLKAVERIEGPHKAKHYTIDDLKEIIAKYKALKRQLEAHRAAA